MSSSSLFKSAKNFIAKHYGANPGSMLIHTGVIGWILSSAAQVVAIAINDKIPKEQKMYMIPQEMADAAVNILSFYAVTQTFKSVALKLVNTGKWLPETVRNFLNNANFKDVGKKTFDVMRDAKLTGKIADSFTEFKDGIDLVATTMGSVLSCNILTPIVRNEIAANRQKRSIARMQEKDSIKDVTNPTNIPQIKTRPTMQTFQSLANARYNSSSLKI